MNPKYFKKLRSSTKELTPPKRHLLVEDLQSPEQHSNPALAQIDKAFAEDPSCPHGKHQAVSKYGRAKGLKRTDTPLAGNNSLL